MNVQTRDELIEKLCKGSDRQIDDSLKPRLKALQGRPNEEGVQCELLGIIDDCVYAALASGFTIKVLHVMLMNIGYTEGKLADRNKLLSTDLTENEKHVLQDRFKWEAAQHSL